MFGHEFASSGYVPLAHAHEFVRRQTRVKRDQHLRTRLDHMDMWLVPALVSRVHRQSETLDLKRGNFVMIPKPDRFRQEC